jgi:hypothetical protein
MCPRFTVDDSYSTFFNFIKSIKTEKIYIKSRMVEVSGEVCLHPNDNIFKCNVPTYWDGEFKGLKSLIYQLEKQMVLLQYNQNVSNEGQEIFNFFFKDRIKLVIYIYNIKDFILCLLFQG